MDTPKLITFWALMSLGACLTLAISWPTAATVAAPFLASDETEIGAKSNTISPKSATTAPGNCTVDYFTSIAPQGVVIERVQHVTSGFFVETGNIGYPTSPQDLPNLCAVIANNVTGSYRFGMFLPDRWGTSSSSSSSGTSTTTSPRRFLVIGSYAFLGGINWLDMGVGVKYGAVTLATDTGHRSGAGDITWANTTQKQVNWAYAALQGSIAAGKVLTERYYRGARIEYTYFTGCSTGGREALKQIQRDPAVFDGALVGAPAWDTKHLMPWLARLASWNLPESATSSVGDAALFTRLHAEVLRQCDALDGVRDNIVSDPLACRARFDISRVWCDASGSGSNTAACWSRAQTEMAGKMYADYVIDSSSTGTSNTNSSDSGKQQKLVYKGAEYGSETEWATYLLPADPNGAQNVRRNFDAQYERFFMGYGGGWQTTSYNDSVVLDAETRDRDVGASADAFDRLAAYRARGGKIIMYAGLADNVVPVQHTTLFYNRTVEAIIGGATGAGAGSVDDFFRYFQIPGMKHCWGTPDNVKAPWMMGGAGQAVQRPPYASGWSVPLGYNNAQHDALLALMDWVEKGRAVNQIVASEFNFTDSSQQNIVLYRQRPLCPYPKTARWDGKGNQNSATSWSCG